jgi:hypothetical protein
MYFLLAVYKRVPEKKSKKKGIKEAIKD